MPYKQIPWENMEDHRLQKAFKHADMYLHDVYGMFHLPIRENGQIISGGGNFAITLVLLCLLDGLANIFLPGVSNNDGGRFKNIIRVNKFWHWGPVEKGWVERGKAAKILYVELRNPLVHEMAVENPKKIGGNRPDGNSEPFADKWVGIPDKFREISYIDSLTRWNDDWPILNHGAKSLDGPNMNLCLAGLYWVTKNLVLGVIQDKHSLNRMTLNLLQ